MHFKKRIITLPLFAILVFTSACGPTENRPITISSIIERKMVIESVDVSKVIEFREPNFKNLDEFKSYLSNFYLGKDITLSKKPAHEFLFNSGMTGSMSGFIHGGWTQTNENENLIDLSTWLSGSMYMPWGTLVIENGEILIRAKDITLKMKLAENNN